MNASYAPIPRTSAESCGEHRWTPRPLWLDTFSPPRAPYPPTRTPAPPGIPIQLDLLPTHLTRENAAVVQTCVPFVEINGDSYRMRAHKARADNL